MPLDGFGEILDLFVIVLLDKLPERFEKLHIVVEEGLGAEDLLEEVRVHGLFVGILSILRRGVT